MPEGGWGFSLLRSASNHCATERSGEVGRDIRISETPANVIPIILMPPLPATSFDTTRDGATRTWRLAVCRSRAAARFISTM